MNTLERIGEIYGINIRQKRQPLEIPNKTRVDLSTLFSQLGFRDGVEVGVEEGIYSEILLNKNPKLTLGCVDAWEAYKGYRDHMVQLEMDMIYERAKTRLQPYKSRCQIIRGYSTTAAKNIPDNSLDFVYLDANHEFAHVVEDLAAWEPKVKVGGIVAGHDYIKRRTNNYLMHVPYAVDAWCSAYQIKPLFILGRKEAKANPNPNKGELRDSTRSWFYVKTERPPIVPGHKWT